MRDLSVWAPDLCGIQNLCWSLPGGLPYEKGGTAHQEILNEPIKGTNLGVA